MRSLTASITEARRSFVTFLLAPGEEDEDEDAARAPAAAADEEIIFLAAKRSAMADGSHSKDLAN